MNAHAYSTFFVLSTLAVTYSLLKASIVPNIGLQTPLWKASYIPLSEPLICLKFIWLNFNPWYWVISFNCFKLGHSQLLLRSTLPKGSSFSNSFWTGGYFFGNRLFELLTTCSGVSSPLIQVSAIWCIKSAYWFPKCSIFFIYSDTRSSMLSVSGCSYTDWIKLKFVYHTARSLSSTFLRAST